MSVPSAEFLCACVARALLDHYKVQRPPVPIRDMLRCPPPDLAGDLGLTESLPFGEALWLRMLSGQGTVFVNPALSRERQHSAMAEALFLALCSSLGGRAVGLPRVPNDELHAQAAYFARQLLMPEELMPAGWEHASAEALARMFQVPTAVAEARLSELAAAPALAVPVGVPLATPLNG